MGMVGHISDMLVVNLTFSFHCQQQHRHYRFHQKTLRRKLRKLLGRGFLLRKQQFTCSRNILFKYVDLRGVESIPIHDDEHERLPEGQHESHAGSWSHSHPNHHVIKKDAALIDKIEGSNTKARNSDGRPAKADLSALGSVGSTVLKEKSYSSGLLNLPHKSLVDASITDGGHEATAVGRAMFNPEETQTFMDTVVGERTQYQMRGPALQGRTDYRGKGRFSSQESEEWRKKPAGKPTSVVISARNVDAQLSMHMQDHCNFKEVPKKEESNPPDNAGTEPCMTSSV